MKTKLIGVGIDAAFANMGFARVEINVINLAEPTGGMRWIDCLGILALSLVSTEGQDKKVVRKSSNDLRRAQELVQAIKEQCTGADFAFVEVPSGSLSAAAARALGIAVGVIASCPIPIIEVSQQEVKLALLNDKTASKDQMITAAMQMWPEAKWLTTKRKGKVVPTKSNEHLADACACVVAGIETQEFKRIIALYEPENFPNYRPMRKRVGR